MKFFKMPVTVKFDEIVEFDGMFKNMIDRYSTLPRTNDGIPFIYDYMWRGYFKEICRELRKLFRYSDIFLLSAGLPEYCRKIDSDIFLEDRINPIILPEGLDDRIARPYHGLHDRKTNRSWIRGLIMGFMSGDHPAHIFYFVKIYYLCGYKGHRIERSDRYEIDCYHQNPG